MGFNFYSVYEQTFFYLSATGLGVIALMWAAGLAFSYCHNLNRVEAFLALFTQSLEKQSKVMQAVGVLICLGAYWFWNWSAMVWFIKIDIVFLALVFIVAKLRAINFHNDKELS